MFPSDGSYNQPLVVVEAAAVHEGDEHGHVIWTPKAAYELAKKHHAILLVNRYPQ